MTYFSILYPCSVGVAIAIPACLMLLSRRNSPAKRKLNEARRILGSCGMSADLADETIAKEYFGQNIGGESLLLIKDEVGVICGKQPTVKSESVEEWSVSMIRWLSNYKYSQGFKDAKRTKSV